MNLLGQNVLVLGDHSYAQPFISEGAHVTLVDPYESYEFPEILDYVLGTKLIVFTGGEDIGPHMYGNALIAECGPTADQRDITEQMFYRVAHAEDKPMVGICRGAQFLCAMNGGKLVQHLEGHGSSHIAHSIDGEFNIMVTSSHHQMMVPMGHGYILMYSSNEAFDVAEPALYDVNGYDHLGRHLEPEVVLWQDTKCLGHQPHPEWMEETSDYHRYFIHTVERLLEL